jgi:nucleoporin SEH1
MHINTYNNKKDEKGNKKWQARATLVDSRDSVSDIKFAPRHVGLKLVTTATSLRQN